ncbi:MAG: hypothetical protein U0521_21425 [Anaerolineae bacterium]
MNSRLPDIAFTSKERALPLVTKGAVQQMPDLAVGSSRRTTACERMRGEGKHYCLDQRYAAGMAGAAGKSVWSEIYRANDEIDAY